MVYEEITRTEDDLSKWIKTCKIPIRKIDGNVTKHLQTIYAANSRHKLLVDNTKKRSLADPWVIAHALNENAATYPTIVLLINKGNNCKQLYLKESSTIEDIDNPNNFMVFKPQEYNKLPLKIFPINSDKDILNIYYNNKTKTKLSDIIKIQEGLRIKKMYESDNGDLHIVKQYQFSKYSDIKQGIFIKHNLINNAVSISSSRFINCQKNKILIAEDGLKIEATLDTSKSLCQGGVYFGTLKNSVYNIKTILGILNSKILSVLYENLFSGMHMGGGYLRYRSGYLNELPFPDIINNKTENLIIDKVTSVLELKQKNEFDTTTLEQEIDRLVYELYGLTEEDIEIVEGSVK